ncbi:MAG: hypothetical protein A2Y17_08460 [Clostridiales bacterium GWF2_38_85]|nr:MAG: hypothetical protein A2Y17_08460 [Clostridiales bacterium GWF2_38_85]HBL83775.1 hypothetical protein [Clostridiales bacterium]
MLNHNDLKKASVNFDFDKESLYSDIIKATENKKTLSFKRRIRGLITATLILCIMLTGCFTAYAVSPEFRNTINLWFLGGEKTDEIPEGFTPIYTVEDLDNIRNNLKGNYILMNDLYFEDSDFEEGGRLEGGWKPIGGGITQINYTKDTNIFTGILNGNGYIIYNLRYNTESNYIGLFGYTINYTQSVNLEESTADEFDLYKGLIMNLGISGATLDIKLSNYYKTENPFSYYSIGLIAGRGSYFAGCFIEDSEINVHLSNVNVGTFKSVTSYTAQIGGICGNAHLIDSCYSDVAINIISDNHVVDEQSTLYVSGMCSNSAAMLTSIDASKINIDAEENVIIKDINNKKDYFIPVLISKDNFEMIINKIRAESQYDADKFQAYYVYVTPSTDLSVYTATKYNLYTLEIDSESYLLDPRAIPAEIIRLEKILTKFLLDEYTVDEIKAFGKGTIVGVKYCYTLDDDTIYTEDSFEGFDFEKIWKIVDGKPRLRIFD